MKNLIVSLGIDLTKISKEKIKVDEKGRKWLYVQVSVSLLPDQYGNHSAIWENQSKEERENQKRNYLGNGKITFFDNGSMVGISPVQPTENQENDIEDLPF